MLRASIDYAKALLRAKRLKIGMGDPIVVRFQYERLSFFFFNLFIFGGLGHRLIVFGSVVTK